MSPEPTQGPPPAGPGADPAPALSEAALAAVADLVPHVVFAKDAAGRYLLSSRAHAAFLGRESVDEVIGRTADELGRGDDERLGLIEGAGLPAAAPAGLVEERTVPDAAGAPRTWRIRRRGIRRGAGGPEGVVGIAIDVTDLGSVRVEAEEKVSRRMQELADAVRESEAFGYSLSHDLRAPVRAVSGFAAILLEDHGAALPEDARRIVERIAAAGATMSAMVDGMLSLSQISRVEPRRAAVDLATLAREVWADVVLAEPGRAAEFLAEDCGEVWADPALVRSVVQNLLANAFKYTRGRHPARVRLGVGGEGPARHFYVSDNGTGFDMAHAGKLFGIFQRLHLASEFEGTGIGLATAHRIVLQHGGRIWAEAAPGEGATFRFTFGTQRP